jgi:hypothetical protein
MLTFTTTDLRLSDVPLLSWLDLLTSLDTRHDTDALQNEAGRKQKIAHVKAMTQVSLVYLKTKSDQ